MVHEDLVELVLNCTIVVWGGTFITHLQQLNRKLFLNMEIASYLK